MITPNWQSKGWICGWAPLSGIKLKCESQTFDIFQRNMVFIFLWGTIGASNEIDRVSKFDNFLWFSAKQNALWFSVADTQLNKRFCPSVRRSIGPSVHRSAMVIELESVKTGISAIPPLPTHLQLVLAVYPALFSFRFPHPLIAANSVTFKLTLR